MTERKAILFRDIPRGALFARGDSLYIKVGPRSARAHTAWNSVKVRFRATDECRISDGERNIGKRSKLTH